MSGRSFITTSPLFSDNKPVSRRQCRHKGTDRQDLPGRYYTQQTQRKFAQQEYILSVKTVIINVSNSLVNEPRPVYYYLSDSPKYLLLKGYCFMVSLKN